MQQVDRWTPTKYALQRGRLRASSCAEDLFVGSWLIAELVAPHLDAAVREHCRGNVLDLGCGRAPLYALYRDFATSVTCVDWVGSEHEVCHADVLCDLNQPIPLPDASFDTIIFSDVLEHLYRPQQVMAEIRRILRPGGKLLMTVPFMYWLHEQPNDFHRYTRFAIERLTGECGLEIVSLHEVGGAPAVLADVFAKLVARVRFVGAPVARAVQSCCRWWISTRLGRRVSSSTAARFPLEYIVVAACSGAGT